MRIWLTILMLVMAVPSFAQSMFIELGQASGGPVVLHGNVLNDSIFRFQAHVTITGRDTVWNGLFINGLAVDLPASTVVRSSETPTPRQQLEARIRTARVAFTQQRQAARQTITRTDLVAWLAEAYAEDTSLVTRTSVVSDREFLVCWRSNGLCEHMMLDDGLNAQSTTPRLEHRADELLRLINRGRMVFISRGAVFAPRSKLNLRYREEIAALQRGKSLSATIFPSRRLARDIQHPPVTLEALRWEELR